MWVKSRGGKWTGSLASGWIGKNDGSKVAYIFKVNIKYANGFCDK